MKILLAHNLYQQRGGEETVFEQEKNLLERGGHQVQTYCRSNDEAGQYSGFAKLGLARQTIWSDRTFDEVSALLRRDRPDVVHVHNTFVMISPSIYWACDQAGIPVVQTLHNYRLFCPNGYFLRDGGICEDCVQYSLWHSVQHACYRQSRLQSAAVAATLAWHRRKGTWRDRITTYIALTEFARAKFISAGLPAEKVVVKPNFVDPDPGVRSGNGEFACFVGRIVPEKGIATLLRAWELVPRDIPLVVCGDGPMLEQAKATAQQRGLANVQFAGRLTRAATLQTLKRARFLVFPSEWYESFPMTILEAYACGVPVIASAVGALLEIVEDGKTGKVFKLGDAAELAATVEWAWRDPEVVSAMGAEARRTYESKYTGEANYVRLMQIYQDAIRVRANEASVPAGTPA
jgi:glycosyltransferase involved in cell wall biosynthesis